MALTDKFSSLNYENNTSDFLDKLAHPSREALKSLTMVDLEPPTTLDPIDQVDAKDPQLLGMYAQEIYAYLRESEGVNSPSPDYMELQPDLNHKMRSILIDWLVSVHKKYKLLPDTLFIAVNIIDRYLSKKTVIRQQLQLVGVTAMLIAAKYEEIYPPEIKEFLHITDRAYTKEQILKCEIDVLGMLEFKITFPTAFRFLERYAKIAELSEVETMLARYLAELSLVHYGMLKYSPSLIAASSIYLGEKIIKREKAWVRKMTIHTAYQEADLRHCAKELFVLFQSAPKCTLSAVLDKFSKRDYLSVSSLRVS